MNQAFFPRHWWPVIPWLVAALIALAVSAAPVYMGGPGPEDEAAATAASVADAQRTARLQAAIDRECTDHPDPMRCALRVVQQQEPHNWKEAEI